MQLSFFWAHMQDPWIASIDHLQSGKVLALVDYVFVPLSLPLNLSRGFPKF